MHQNQDSNFSPTNRFSNPRQTHPDSDFYLKMEDQEFIPPEHKYIEHEKFGSAFFKDNNEEEYVLQRAFQPGNFTYLRKLPDQISRNCILEGRKDRVMDQIEDQAIKRLKNPAQKEAIKNKKISEIKKAKIGSLGYFQVFPYKESDYELPKKLQKSERQQKDRKRKQICGLDFRPAGFDSKLKYEDPFRYVDRKDATTTYCGKSQYLFPFHYPADVYDAFHESEKRQKIITDELKLAGEFIPSKTTHSLDVVSKAKLPEILNEIEFYFKKLFKDKVGYFIGVNKRDYIEIMFEDKYRDDNKVQMTLSGMLEHQILSKFRLRRNLHRWGTTSDITGHLEYVVLPPWVKDPDEVLRVSDSGKGSRQTR